MRHGRPTPYVGITGFMHRDEIYEAIESMPEWGESRLLMCGVLASPKSLWQGGNSKPNRYPKPWDIRGIWPAPSASQDGGRRAINVLHWCAEPSATSAEQIPMLETALATSGLVPTEGVQINAGLPFDLPALGRCSRVIVQLRPPAMKFGAAWIARYLAKNPRVTDVLLDSSAGTGAGIDWGIVLDVLDELVELCPTIGIVLAGGLCAKALRKPGLRDFLRDHPFVSIDAESGLRDHDDKLDLEELRAYLAEAGEIFPA